MPETRFTGERQSNRAKLQVAKHAQLETEPANVDSVQRVLRLHQLSEPPAVAGGCSRK